MNKLTPAEKVINAFGGINSTARILKLTPATVFQWKKRKHKSKVADGTVPVWHHKKILVEAKKLNIQITHEDLIKAL